MAPRRMARPSQIPVKPREFNVPIPFRVPEHINLAIDVHRNWFDMVRKAEFLVRDDKDLQEKAAKGLQIRERRLPPEILGRLYAQYCDLINQMYDTYLLNVQLQRAQYIQEIISILMKRMYELRSELVHFIVNDYIYVDTSVKQLMKTPYDIQIVVPYHYAVDSRPGSVEELLQKMSNAAERKRIRALKPKKVKVPSDIYSNIELGLELDKPKAKEEQVTDEEKDDNVEEGEEGEEEEEEEEDEWTLTPKRTKDYLKCVFIQKHIRYRKFFVIDFLQKCNTRRTYFARKDIKPVPPELQHKAAGLIQRIYRRFMEAKREHIRNHRRDVLLGILPDYDQRPVKLREATEKLYERRRQTRKKIELKYIEQMEKERMRLLFFKKDQMIEDITQEIMDWFAEWYYGYDYFPQFPYELEGGTLVVLRGEYPTIDEQREDDEAYKKATKGKNKEQLLEEKKQRKRDLEAKKEMEKEKAKKEAFAYFKARCNPLSEVGYSVKISGVTGALTEVLKKYRAAWSMYDQWPLETCGEVIYGYMKPLITEDVMEQMHIECRKIVDQMMRLELKVFIKAQQMMFQRCSTLWPKVRKRPRRRPPKVLPPFEVDDAMLKSVEPIFDLDIMSKPTSKLDEIIGDLNFRAYECTIADPNASFPNPGYGDVKTRLVLSCVFGSGLDPEAPRNKAVMLMGLEKNCKSFLVDCVAGEMGAVKFDISPEVFSSKVKKLGKMLRLVFLASRIFQPSVIYLRDIERVFMKAVPHDQKKLKATSMKNHLKKLVKAIRPTEKVIFIATCSKPLLAKARPMMKMFNEVIIVPKPDYGSLQKYLYDRFQGIRSMPRDFNVSALAKCLQGIGFGEIIQVFDGVMTPERICKLNFIPLDPGEFIEYLIVNNIEPVDDKEYQKMEKLWLQYSPLKKERAEYAIINEKRASAFERLAKVKADKEAKAAKANAGK